MLGLATVGCRSKWLDPALACEQCAWEGDTFEQLMGIRIGADPARMDDRDRHGMVRIPQGITGTGTDLVLDPVYRSAANHSVSLIFNHQDLDSFLCANEIGQE